MINKLTNKFDFDYIHLSLPDYKAKPKDSDKTFAELFRPVIGEDTKLIIVGDVMSQADAEDALNYTDLVAAGRAQLIDANLAAKVVAGKGNEVITEMSEAEEKEQALTPGLHKVMDMETKRPDFAKVLREVDYSKALKVK